MEGRLQTPPVDELSFEEVKNHNAFDGQIFKTLLLEGQETLIQSKSESTPHTHHWIIDEPNGPISHGCCKECGQDRDFKNFLEDYAEENVTRHNDENLYL